MDIDRRRLLTTAACAALTGMARPARSLPTETESPASVRCHPLTRSLLDRAGRIGMAPMTLEKESVERAVRRAAGGAGYDRSLVIKWLPGPAEAVDCLNRLGLDALLNMEGTRFWHVPGLDRPFDGNAFDRAFDVRCRSADVLRVEENDRALMVPKLAVKSSAIASGASPPELFVVRAKLAQVGWLETSWAAAAANAIFEIELALDAGEAEDCRLIDHQLRVFEAHESGLLATWETPDALICVPTTCRSQPLRNV
jgi:hypothetical protein